MDEGSPMEQEFNLRQYSALIMKHWRKIGGLTVGSVLIAGLISFLVLPPMYAATATAVATTPSYRLNFDTRIQSVRDVRASTRAYAAVAKNAELLLAVIQGLGDGLPAELRSAESLGAVCSISAGADQSVMQLTVRYTDPQVAADVANTWASEFVAYIRALYGLSGEDVQRLEEQTAVAEQKLHALEQAVDEYQKINPTLVLSQTIASQSAALASYITAETNIQLALQDARTLKQQLEAVGTASLGQASNLSALLTELNSLSAQRELGPQIEISLGAAPGLDASVSERVQYLDSLIDALNSKVRALAEARAEIPEEILGAQGELQQAQTEMARLVRNRTLAEESYLALSRKLDERRIASQLELGEVSIAARAVVPVRPSSPNKLFNLAVGAVLGLALGISAAFAAEYLGKPSKLDRS